MRRIGNTHLETLVHRNLAEILHTQSGDPRFSKVTISRVETSPNLSFARVFVSVFPSEEKQKIIKTLNHAAGFFSRQLGHTLKTHNTPRLQFIYDSGFDQSDEIEKIIRQQKKTPTQTDG